MAAEERPGPRGRSVSEVPPNWPGPELANGTFEGLDVPAEMLAAGRADGVPERPDPVWRAPAGQDVADRELGSPGESKR